MPTTSSSQRRMRELGPALKQSRPIMPVTTRSKLVLEVASELVALRGKPWCQAIVYLREQGPGDWTARLFASDTPAGINAVVNGEADMGIINPAGPLTVAYRGHKPYDGPQPVRVITVLPHYDQFVFAVNSDLGLTSFEEIGEKKVPIKISLRGQMDDSTHFALNHVLDAAGFSLDALRSWGGDVLYHPGMANQKSRSDSIGRGEVSALFDEGVSHVMEVAEQYNLTVLPLREATIQKLETIGYRRGIISKTDFSYLPADVLTLDFSGWPVFCHRDTPDDLVAAICAALEARSDKIPYEYVGPLLLDRMCNDTPEGPLDVPLHTAAERFWRERGYLD